MESKITYEQLIDLMHKSDLRNEKAWSEFRNEYRFYVKNEQKKHERRSLEEDKRRKEEDKRRKEEDKRRKEEEKRRKEEEKRRKEEEKRRKEEEKNKKEEEKSRKEENLKRDKEEEERRKEEVKRREEEAKRKIDEITKREQAEERRSENWEKEWLKLRASIKEIHGELGGIGKSNGEIAEDFFYSGLKKSMHIFDIDIEEIEKNRNKFRKSLQLKGEYDIILTNSSVIVLVEVKYKFKERHVIKFVTKQIPKYKVLFPERKDYKVYGAIAGFTFEDKAIELANEYGLFILTQSGENIEIVKNATITY